MNYINNPLYNSIILSMVMRVNGGDVKHYGKKCEFFDEFRGGKL